MKAKTVAQVIAAEAGGKTRAQRFQSMLDIVSAAANRAKATGVTLKDIVSVKSQFNAYNSKMPPGTPALTSLAQQAISYVEQNGPVHAGTYYATPETVQNLPKGLVEIPGASPVHTVFQDPQNRAIITAAGTKRVNVSKLPDVAPIPAARPTEAAAAAMAEPSAERFGYEASPERFGRVGLAEQVARAVSETSPLGEMTMAGSIPSQAPGAVRDGVARDMIDTAMWDNPAGFAKPALANAAISRVLSPPSSPPSIPGSWQGIGATLGGFRAPSELSNSFGLANIGNLASVQQATRPGFAPPSNFSGGTPAISPLNAAPVGQVSRATLGPALARPSAPPSNFAKGTMAAPRGAVDSMIDGPLGISGGGLLADSTSRNVSAMQAGAQANAYADYEAQRANAFSGLAAPAKPSTPIAERFGPAPTLGYSGKTAAEIAAIGDSVRANPAAPSKASYGSMRPTVAQMSGPSLLGYAPTKAAPSIPAARPTANITAPAFGGAFNSIGTSAPRSASPAARPASVSAPAPQSNNLADYDAAGNYIGAAKNPSVGFATNPSQLGGITMANPKFAPPTVEQLQEALYPSVPTVLDAPPAYALPSFTPVSNFSQAPAPPRATAYDVYSGLANSAMDNTGRNRVDSLPGGVTSVTNQYGAVTGMTPGGYQTAVGSMPSIPGMSMPSKSTVGGAVKGGLVGAGVAGPVGGVIGALAGALAAKAIADRKSPTAATPGQPGGGLGGLFGGLFGGGKTTGGASSGKSSASKSSPGSYGRSGSGSYGSNPNSNSLRI